MDTIWLTLLLAGACTSTPATEDPSDDTESTGDPNTDDTHEIDDPGGDDPGDDCESDIEDCETHTETETDIDTDACPADTFTCALGCCIFDILELSSSATGSLDLAIDGEDEVYVLAADAASPLGEPTLWTWSDGTLASTVLEALPGVELVALAIGEEVHLAAAASEGTPLRLWKLGAEAAEELDVSAAGDAVALDLAVSSDGPRQLLATWSDGDDATVEFYAEQEDGFGAQVLAQGSGGVLPGASLAMTVDSAGIAHLAWRTDDSLTYYRGVLDKWWSDEVGTALDAVGVVLDEDEKPVVCGADSDGPILHSQRSSGWHSRSLATDGSRVHLARRGDGLAAVSTHAGDTRLVYQAEAREGSRAVTVHESAATGRGARLAIDSDGDPFIAFYDDEADMAYLAVPVLTD